MTDRIRIEDLKLHTIIGINDDERRNMQDVVINLTLFVDIGAAARYDDIDYAPVNYRTLTKSIIAFVEGSSFRLIEALAEAIAGLCLREPGIEKVRVAVDKPGALRFSRSVGVSIERAKPLAGSTKKQSRNRAFLSLGSNIDPEKNLPAAVREISRFGRVVQVSTVWQTVPVGPQGQPDYLNAVLLLETGLSARKLKKEVIDVVEATLGRVRTTDRFAPRTIDIDIMLFNSDHIRLGQRRIPDPEILERPFVAIPLAELAPDYVHPDTGETLATISARFDPAASGMRRRGDVTFFF